SQDFPGSVCGTGCVSVNGSWRVMMGSGGVVAAVRETRVAEPGTDGEHAPTLVSLHDRQRAQTLYDSVVVDDDGGLVPVDARDFLADAVRQVKAAAWPITGLRRFRSIRPRG